MGSLRADNRAAPRSIVGLVLGAALIGTPARADHALTLLLVDTARSAPTAARLSVTGADTEPYRPRPDSLCLFHEALEGFFYADSAAVVFVPAGSTRVRASKGLEYMPFAVALEIGSDTTVTVALDRWIEPRDLGWVGGDAQGDLTHSPAAYHPNAAEAMRVVRAEGLRVAHFLDNGYLFTGEVNAFSDSEALFFSSEEYRSPTFGHLGLLGIDELVHPFTGYAGWPLNGGTIEAVRAMEHALATIAHPLTTHDYFDVSEWPGSGLARGVWIDAAAGTIDAIDVLSYSNHAAIGFAADTLWSRLWNAGFAVPGLAGTDACVGRLEDAPLGALRAYVRVPDPYAPPAELYDAWIEGARRGRTFVTAGPLLTEFDVGGAGAGETLDVSSGMPIRVPVHARFESAVTLRRIEVIVNGSVVETRTASGRSYDLDTTVPVLETSWIAVRHDGNGNLPFHPTGRPFAQPTPVLVRLGGDELTSAESGGHALAELDLLDSLLALVADFPSVSESLSVAAGIETARAVWTARSNAPPAPFHLEAPCYACLIDDALPVFAWEASDDPDSSGALTYRFVLSEDPEFASVLVDTSGLAAPSWTPPSPLAIGTRHYWRVRAEDALGARRWAEEIDWWVEPATATGAASGAAATALRFAVSPNPARPGSAGILFAVSAALRSEALIRIFGADGREVRAVRLPAGMRTVRWDGTDRAGRPVPGGVYFYRILAEGAVQSGKVCIVR